MDFYIPQEALDMCKKNIMVDNIDIYYVIPECWIVFKARRGSNKDMAGLAMIKQMVEEKLLTLDKTVIEKLLDLYEEDKHYIIDRLKNIKLV